MLTEYTVYDSVSPDRLEDGDLIRYLNEVFTVTSVDDDGSAEIIVNYIDEMGDEGFLLIPYSHDVDLLTET